MEHIYKVQTCSPEEIEAYRALFKEFRYVFSWIYEEMPTIYPSIVIHEIKPYVGAKPIHQKL